MDQRVALVADWLRHEWTMMELADRYQNDSPPTGESRA